MSILLVLFTAAATVVAADSPMNQDGYNSPPASLLPMPSCSSREACGAASEAEASGVVLLSRGSAMSRARFHDAETSETKHDNKDIHSSIGRLAAIEPAPRLQTQTPTSSVLLTITTHLHDGLHGKNGVIFVILLTCLLVFLFVIWRWRQQSKQAEIYEDPDEYAWKHEFWVRGHRPQATFDRDSPQVRSILPRATTKAQVAQLRQQEHEARAQMGSAQSLASLGSAGAAPPGTSGALGSADAVGAGGTVGPTRMLSYLDGKVDSAVDGAQQGFTGVRKGTTNRLVAVGQKIEETTSWATRSVFKKGDRATGQTLTGVTDKVADSAAVVKNRWNEARSGNV